MKVVMHEGTSHTGTSSCNKSRGQVLSCELAIFAAKSTRRTSPTNSNWFEFLDKSLRPVAQNASCELLVEQVAATSPPESLRVYSSGD